MSEEGRKRQTEAGCRNLMKWKASQPGGHVTPNLKHGVGSATIRQRYSDLRTTEGQRLKAVIDTLVADLGGPENINAGQQVILGALKAKFIVLFQISDYSDKQESIINAEGSLMNVLSRNFLAYAESIRRDLEVLYGFSRKKSGKVPTLEELIAQRECGK
jgi:hypothetical protein